MPWDVNDFLRGAPKVKMAGLSPYLAGTGANLPGSSFSTSTTAPSRFMGIAAAQPGLASAAPKPLGRDIQRDLSIATLLGRAAGAVKPGGIGARLGEVGQQMSTQLRYDNAMARMLAGETLAPTELEGIPPELLQQMTVIRGVNQEQQLKVQEAEQKKEKHLLDQRMSKLEFLNKQRASLAETPGATKIMADTAKQLEVPELADVLSPLDQTRQMLDLAYEDWDKKRGVEKTDAIDLLRERSTLAINEAGATARAQGDAQVTAAVSTLKQMAELQGTTPSEMYRVGLIGSMIAHIPTGLDPEVSLKVYAEGMRAAGLTEFSKAIGDQWDPLLAEARKRLAAGGKGPTAVSTKPSFLESAGVTGTSALGMMQESIRQLQNGDPTMFNKIFDLYVGATKKSIDVTQGVAEGLVNLEVGTAQAVGRALTGTRRKEK